MEIKDSGKRWRKVTYRNIENSTTGMSAEELKKNKKPGLRDYSC